MDLIRNELAACRIHWDRIWIVGDFLVRVGDLKEPLSGGEGAVDEVGKAGKHLVNDQGWRTACRGGHYKIALECNFPTFRRKKTTNS